MKTGLKILSVLMIIIGVLALFIGLPIVVLMLGATDGSAGGNAVVVLATAMTLASGVFEIVGGVLGAIAFAMCVIALLLDFSVQSLCGSIVPLLYLICASAVRKSA